MSSSEDLGQANSYISGKASPRLKSIVSNETVDTARSPGGNMSTRSKSQTKLKKYKSRPHLKRIVSGGNRLVFSVDDDINEYSEEEELDLDERKGKSNYMEGYNDGVRSVYQNRAKGVSSAVSSGILHENNEASKTDVIVEANEGIVETPNAVAEPSTWEDGNRSSGVPGNEMTNGDEQDRDDSQSVHSSSSTDTIESLNLRERQNAINSTHPFGIKIWKPSLYKKERSVATRADEDIHDFDPKNAPKSLFWGTYLSNFIWSLTFGLFLYILCMACAFILFVSSGFVVSRSSRPYFQLLLKLGRYWLYPFGKFVMLNKDDNYLEEDELDGRSISEFHRWREQEEGRLFFAPPRRYTNSNESRALLKDHKGRPLRDAYSSLDDNNTIDETDTSDVKVRFFGRGRWTLGRLIFYFLFYVLLQPIFYTICILCWLFVFTIPMANLTKILCDHLRRHPLALHFEFENHFYKTRSAKKSRQSIILCTYRSCGFHYYKYTIDGTNVFFINLLTAVIFVISDFYILKEKWEWKTWFTDSSFIFCACLFSIIPLAYFIGQAVASISAQSSMGVGAVINAFFSTIVEIFLYCVALNQSKGKLVEGSMIGSILGGVLLLPGLSMCGGAFKRKTQRYNPRSAGVSSTMLLFAMVVMFAPSLFYEIYGSYEIKCKQCSFSSGSEDDCVKCRVIQHTFTLDRLYYNVLRPFSLIVAASLFLAYVCGLFFTLRTHASLIWATASHEPLKKDDNLRSPSVSSLNAHSAMPKATLPPLATNLPETRGSSSRQLSPFPSTDVMKAKSPRDMLSISRRPSGIEDTQDVENGGHDAPNWSRGKSTVILLGATLLYAIIAEILVDTVDSVISDHTIDTKFLGLTIFALVPNTTEFLNAISFAIGGNVALSMEIGSAYALQVVLIQIPSLVVYSIYKGFVDVDQIFSLIFPRWDIIATLISIYLFTYIYAEGKSNYFKGVILILIYFVVMIGFWFNDKIEAIDDGYNWAPGPGRSPFSAA